MEATIEDEQLQQQQEQQQQQEEEEGLIDNTNKEEEEDKDNCDLNTTTSTDIDDNSNNNTDNTNANEQPVSNDFIPTNPQDETLIDTEDVASSSNTTAAMELDLETSSNLEAETLDDNASTLGNEQDTSSLQQSKPKRRRWEKRWTKIGHLQVLQWKQVDSNGAVATRVSKASSRSFNDNAPVTRSITNAYNKRQAETKRRARSTRSSARVEEDVDVDFNGWASPK